MEQSGTRTGSGVLGLTGGIACGKSTVGDLLLDLGAAERIDADAVVHELLSLRGDVTAQVEMRFGREVINADGSVDRPLLGRIVFADPPALHDLEAITYPAVHREIQRRVREARARGGTIVLDAVKLLQSDLVEMCEGVWVVRCSPENQMGRLTGQRGMEPESAADRMRAQPNFDHPSVVATIENDGSVAQLRAQVEAAWQAWNERAARAGGPG